MNIILKDLTGYIDFLRECGWYVMLSCFGNNFGDCLPTLLDYEIHQLPVCAYLKSDSFTRKKCIHNKRMLERKSFTCTYYSHCYAGVEEFVYPIVYEGKALMCVNISGYRGKIERSGKCAELVERYGGSKFRQLYSELSEHTPDMDKINQIIRPLEYMVRELYRKCSRERKEESEQTLIFRKALIFIYENYTCKISCADVAHAVGYSEAYLRQIFKAESPYSIMEYINNARISRAAEMLKNTACPITDVAFSCGFEDSNYFSTAFKKRYGVSPKRFRNNHLRLEQKD